MKRLFVRLRFSLKRAFREKNPNYGFFYAAPTAIWLTVFFVVPISVILLYSFLKKGMYGGVEPVFSLSAYVQLFNPNYGLVALNTIVIATAATVLTILIALPCGYYMARSSKKTFLLFLVIIPFWTNFLIRIYAWIAILGNNGFLNDMLRKFGLVQDHVQFLYNPVAVVVVLVYTYLPYAILPLYSTIEKFDFSLLEAARDLGAGKTEAVTKILLPNIRAGLMTAVLFTFIPIFGAYAVPLLIGGKESYMIGNVIADQVTKVRNWPLASAFSVVITVVTTLGLVILMGMNSGGGALTPAAGAGADAHTDTDGGGR